MSWESRVVLSTMRTHTFSQMVLCLVEAGVTFSRDLVSGEILFEYTTEDYPYLYETASFEGDNIADFHTLIDKLAEEGHKIGVQFNSASVDFLFLSMVDHHEIYINDAPYVNNAPYDEKHLKIVDVNVITNEILIPLFEGGFEFDAYDFINRNGHATSRLI